MQGGRKIIVPRSSLFLRSPFGGGVADQDLRIVGPQEPPGDGIAGAACHGNLAPRTGRRSGRRRSASQKGNGVSDRDLKWRYIPRPVPAPAHLRNKSLQQSIPNLLTYLFSLPL